MRLQWEFKQQNAFGYLTVPAWNELGAVAAFTTRNGGHSTGAYKSLNMSLHVGDDRELVIANRETVSQSLGFELRQMVCCEQVHGNGVAVVDKQHAGRGSTGLHDTLPGCDAMVTDCPALFLTEYYADCIPVYFFDPIKRVIGLAHSGWKGTALRIAEATVTVMRDRFGCCSEDIRVFIGPGIGPECFAVDADRRSQVERLFTFHDQIIYSYNENQYVWDLHLSNRLIIEQSGIPKDNIISCRICTACNPELFFSYRGTGGHTGRMAAVLGLLD